MARVTDVWNSRTCDRSDARRSTLTRKPPVLPFRASVVCERDLDVGPLALAEHADGVVAAPSSCEKSTLSYRVRRSLLAVVEVGVEAVLVGGAVEDPQPHLLRRAVRPGHVGPPRRRRGGGGGERGPPGEPVRVVELQAEAGRERRVVGGRDVVRGDAAARAEVAEVDGGAVDGAGAPAGPLDLGDPLAAALGGLGQRLGLQHGRAERRRAGGERLAVDVERVVGRPVDARPGAGGERVPAGPGVRRRLREQPAVGGLGAAGAAGRGSPARPVRRSDGVLLDAVLHEAVGGEEQQLVVAAPVAVLRPAPCRP